jgi:hypothetical protein
MIDELRQRLITGLAGTDPWAIGAPHDHDLETFTDFTDEELQLIQQHLLNHPRDVLSPPVSRLFERDSAYSENEDAEEDMRAESLHSHHVLSPPVPELIRSNLREELMAAAQELRATNEWQKTRTYREQVSLPTTVLHFGDVKASFREFGILFGRTKCAIYREYEKGLRDPGPMGHPSNLTSEGMNQLEQFVTNEYLSKRPATYECIANSSSVTLALS